MPSAFRANGTGIALTGSLAYNHSFYIDLIISHVAGIQIGEEGIRFDPIDIGLDYFKLENVIIRGDSYTVSYRKEECRDPKAADMKAGYHVYKNNKEIKR